jgi:hypothetical protein
VNKETRLRRIPVALRYIVLRSRLGDILLATQGIAPESSIYTLQSVDKERACVTTYHSAHHGLASEAALHGFA